MTDIPEAFQRLGIALGLGLLVGMQRQKASSELAGIRTFPIITLFGALCALLADKFGGWLVGLGFVALAIVIATGDFLKSKSSTSVDPGITTEVAALLLFAVGAYVMVGYVPVALTVGAGATLLLHFKGFLHEALKKIGDKDLHAIMQFVLIALVVLPVLPDQSFGPFEVINPFQTWLVVVLIVGISLTAYLAYRLFGARLGTVLGGFLGGLISSTATTVSYAQKCKADEKIAPFAATVIVIASSVAFARIIAELFVVAPRTALSMAVPLSICCAVMFCGAGVLMLKRSTDGVSLDDQDNPAELKTALIFGLLYTGISFAVAATKAYIGDSGLYVVGAISGLTDVDALTLSTARMAETGKLSTQIAWHVILIGALANLLFKASAVILIGRAVLTRYVAPVFLVGAITGVVLMLLWPKDFSIPGFQTASTGREAAGASTPAGAVPATAAPQPQPQSQPESN